MNLNNATELLGMLVLAAAALGCFAVWRRSGGIWGALAVLYLLLGAEVLLSGRHLLSGVLRDAVRGSTFYEERTGVIALLILALLVGVLVFFCFWLIRRTAGAPAKLAMLAGLGMVFVFALELTSLHRMDALLYRPTGPVFAVGWLWAGLSGITVIAALWAGVRAGR